MKLSKTSWIFLIAGALFIAAISLGWIYSQQSSQQAQLNRNLNEARQKLSQINFDDLNAEQEELNQQIEQINSQTETIKVKLSSDKDSIDVTNLILEIAQNCNVDVTEITSPGLSQDSLESINCETLSLSIRARGEISDIINFVGSISKRLPTSIEKSVQVDKDEETFSTSLSLMIYNYKGE